MCPSRPLRSCPRVKLDSARVPSGGAAWPGSETVAKRASRGGAVRSGARVQRAMVDDQGVVRPRDLLFLAVATTRQDLLAVRSATANARRRGWPVTRERTIIDALPLCQ